MAYFVLGPRLSGAIVLADSPAGPVITSATPNPIDQADTLTIVIGAQVPAGQVVLRFGSYEVAQTHSSWVEASGQTTIITPITPGGLPFSGNILLRVKPLAVADIDATIIIEPTAGKKSVVIASPSTAVGSVLRGFTGNTPLNGWQMEHDDFPNTTLLPSGTFTQVVQRDFSVRVWDASDNTRGAFGSAFLAAGISDVNGGVPLVAGQLFTVTLSRINANDVSFLTLTHDTGTKWTVFVDSVTSSSVVSCRAPSDIPTGSTFTISALESKTKKDIRILKSGFDDLLARVIALENP